MFKKNKNRYNVTCLVMFIIILFFSFLALCKLLQMGFRYEEIKQRERFEIYNDLEIRLKQIREMKEEYTIAMFRETYHCPIEDVRVCNTIVDVADEYGISGQVLINLGWEESRLDSEAVGDLNIYTPSGVLVYSRGTFQISKGYNPQVSDECAFDLICSSHWTANKIAEGKGYLWTAYRNLYLNN